MLAAAAARHARFLLEAGVFGKERFFIHLAFLAVKHAKFSEIKMFSESYPSESRICPGSIFFADVAMRSYKFRIYPSKLQEKEMLRHLWIAKNLWNELLAYCKSFFNDFQKFPSKSALQIMSKNSGLFSQTSQEIAHRVEKAVWRYLKLKKEGKKAGFPRFKPFEKMKSLHYPQHEFGFWLKENGKLEVTQFGGLSIVRHREIKGRIKTLSIKREASGKWLACLAAEEPPIEKFSNNKPKVGIDLGLETFAALSNGEKFPNPRHIKKYESRLAFLQRKRAKTQKGSRNRKKANETVARHYLKLKNTRYDFLHKLSHTLVNSYSLIALEDLACQQMAEKKFGKQIHDAAWGSFARMIQYKAESAGAEAIFVNPKNTTRECCMCGNLQDMPLDERIYSCNVCGNSMDRDVNAARNILARATAGMAGSNASGEGTIIPSLKEEAHAFRHG